MYVTITFLVSSLVLFSAAEAKFHNKYDFDIKTDDVAKEWSSYDRRESQMLSDLLDLDRFDRQLVKRLLDLSSKDRQIIGHLAKDINKIIERGHDIHAPKSTNNRAYISKEGSALDENVEQNLDVIKEWVQKEIEKHIMKNVYVLKNIDRRVVEDLLWMNAHQRKIVANLAHEINHFVGQKGVLYPKKLWKSVLQINKGDDIVDTKFV